ncbi:MAG: BON domain-containing protein [Candidatus Solibacter sp.]
MQSLIRSGGMLALAAFLIGIPGYAQKDKDKDKNVTKSADRMRTPQDRLSREVRHELVMLPYYGVFDNLAYKVEGSTVTLLGQVTRPTLKSDAENVVKDIEGVEKVDNRIQVLPLSSMDDGVRIAVYRAIYGQVGLDRYGLQAVPPIHIIVANGKVDLQGVVANEADKNMAGIRANGVSGVFSVTNNLQIEADHK